LRSGSPTWRATQPSRPSSRLNFGGETWLTKLVLGFPVTYMPFSGMLQRGGTTVDDESLLAPVSVGTATAAN
jgi:hypothetical protein